MSKVSIIIVEYQSAKYSINLIKSIKKYSNNVDCEIIIVDNGPSNQKNIFMGVADKYIFNRNNLGYGSAINKAAKFSVGKYLLILNNDLLFLNNCVKELSGFLNLNSKVAVVSPVLYDENNNIYPLQGTSELTPLSAIMSLSIMDRFWPSNPVSVNYWQKSAKKNITRKVDVVPGTALMIRKDVFKKVRGFDSNIFLYFEEADLCKRINQTGFYCYILSKAKMVHYWGKSSSNLNKNTNKRIFRQSRFYYFKKHYGILSATVVEIFLSINSFFIVILLFLIILLMLITSL